MKNYRTHIYNHYVSAWDDANVPHSLDELEKRGATMRYLINAFFPRKKSASILDLGCGHGTLVHYAKQAGYQNVFGVDVSTQQVALAKQLGIANITQGDLMPVLRATTPASLDTVVTFDVIEHFTKDELIDLVDAIYVALKSGGGWIIHVPNANSPFVGAVRYGDYTHELAFTPASIQQLLKAAGFKSFIFAECGPRVRGMKSLLRVVLWQIVRVLLNLVNAAETGSIGRGYIWSRNMYVVAYK